MISIYDPSGNQRLSRRSLLGFGRRRDAGVCGSAAEMQKQGITFDYYVPDVGWQDSTGDITRFWPHCFPEGPQKVIKRINEAGHEVGAMVYGHMGRLDFRAQPQDGSQSNSCCGRQVARLSAPGQFRYLRRLQTTLFSFGTVFQHVADALLFHIKNNNLRFFKLDASSYFCNSVEHGHLPGKYSTEANFDAVIEVARRTHQASTDLYIMWYWGIRSPFFALHGDSIFETRLRMEAASTVTSLLYSFAMQ